MNIPRVHIYYQLMKRILHLSKAVTLNKLKKILLVITRARANQKMEDKLIALHTKLQDLDKTNLVLHLQHSFMNNKC